MGKQKIPLVYQGYMFSHVGFAEATRNYLLALERQGDFKIKVFPYDMDNIHLKDVRQTARLKKLRYTKITERPVWITEIGPMQIHPTIGYSVGLVVWECKQWPKRFIKNLKRQDEIWTACTWNRDTLAKAGLSGVRVIPHALDPDRFDPSVTESLRQDLNPAFFQFLSIMGYSERKGASDLLEAYHLAFSREEDVVLYLKMHHSTLDQFHRDLKRIRHKFQREDQPFIRVDVSMYPWLEMPRLYKGASAFVLPTRGEGFGLNFTEAMLMELPTIGTDYGPMPDYLNKDNGYPVKIKGFKKDKRMDWIVDDYKNKLWPVIDIKHLRHQMREVFEDYTEAKKKAKKARQDIIKYCHPDRIGKLIGDRIKEIWSTMEHKKLKHPVCKEDFIK